MKDLVIIGAGPIGLFAGYYAGLRDLDTTIMECDKIGGQLTNQYPESNILDIPGHIKIKAEDLIENLKDQMITTLGKNVIHWEGKPELHIEKNNECFIIHTPNIFLENMIQTKSILLCTGAGVVKNKRYKINLDGDYLDELIKINYERDKLFDITGGIFAENPTVTILGGGNSAIDYALEQVEKGTIVNVVTRGELKANERTIIQLRSNMKKIRIFTNTIITGVNYPNAMIQNISNGSKSIIKIDRVSSFLGNYLENTINFINIDLDKKGDYYMVDDKSQTNIPLLYAAGDCAYSEFGMKLLVCGFSQATIAVNHCKSVISNKGMFGGYTSMEK